MANENLLKVVDISKDFTTEGTFSFGGGHRVIHAVDHVTFDLRESETLGILVYQAGLTSMAQGIQNCIDFKSSTTCSPGF